MIFEVLWPLEIMGHTRLLLCLMCLFTCVLSWHSQRTSRIISLLAKNGADISEDMDFEPYDQGDLTANYDPTKFALRIVYCGG